MTARTHLPRAALATLAWLTGCAGSNPPPAESASSETAAAPHRRRRAANAASATTLSTTTASSSASSSYAASTTLPTAAVAGPPDDLVTARVRQDDDVFQRCYEQQALERDDTAEGTVTLHVTLDTSGRIARLTTDVTTTHPDPTLMGLTARCIERHVRTLAFGPQRGTPQEFVVPLTFTSTGARHSNRAGP